MKLKELIDNCPCVIADIAMAQLFRFVNEPGIYIMTWCYYDEGPNIYSVENGSFLVYDTTSYEDEIVLINNITISNYEDRTA